MTAMEQLLTDISVLALPVILAITLHEAAHGFVAWKLGDDTAWRLGRVTFNPLKHIDPLGTVILPLMMYFSAHFLFGWAKPVPVSFGRLGNPRRDMVWVALAGPGVNIALALVSDALFHVLPLLPAFMENWAAATLVISVQINVILALFNMIPLPPLDGGRVAVGLLPPLLARPLAAVEPYGMLLLLVVLVLLPVMGSQLGIDLNVLPQVLGPAVDGVIRVIDRLVGVD
jgi:Zn-dependent protease